MIMDKRSTGLLMIQREGQSDQSKKKAWQLYQRRKGEAIRLQQGKMWPARCMKLKRFEQSYDENK